MASGSQQLSAAWLEGATSFTCCGREINVGKRGSLLQLVAEVRRIVADDGSWMTEVYCMECRDAKREPGMLYHADGTPYMHVLHYLRSGERAA